MADKKTDNWTIFYSWESDLPIDSNQKAIRTVLLESYSKVQNEVDNILITLDEATRDIPGSPDIPSTIFEKIYSADIFVCDLTTINSYAPKEKRKVPNPNVLVELGYAVAILGWDRVIMLFNKEHGEFPIDLPFDIDKRKVIDFKITSKEDNSGKGNLKVEIIDALKTIIKRKPLKTLEKKLLSPEQKKRNIDIANLKWALNTIHIPTMDNFIAEIPAIIVGRIFHFWEGFRAVMKSSLFHVYDKKTLKLLDSFYTHWSNTVSYGQWYRASLNADMYFFGSPNDLPLSTDEQKDFDFLVKEQVKLNSAFKKLLTHVRQQYIEIDLEETSKNAIEEYMNFKARYTETAEKNQGEDIKSNEEGQYEVDNIEDFISCIGSNTVIKLKKGKYNFSEVAKYKGNKHITWHADFDGYEPHIVGVENLKITGEEGVEILIDPRYVWVMKFLNCKDISLERITCGHTTPGGCSGGVIMFESCKDVSLKQCDLFGCGTYGITIINSSDFSIHKSTIRECTYGIARFSGARNVLFRDCTFVDCKEFDLLTIQNNCVNINFLECRFQRNSSPKGDYHFINTDNTCKEIVIEYCQIYNNDVVKWVNVNGIIATRHNEYVKNKFPDPKDISWYE